MSCAASKRVAQMIDAFEPQLVDEDEEVIRQGAAGDFIYIIDQGMFQVLIGSVLGVCACVCACACMCACVCVMGGMSEHGSKGLNIDFESNL